MKPGPVVPIPEGVSNGAPVVGGKDAATSPPTGIKLTPAGGLWRAELNGRVAFYEDDNGRPGKLSVIPDDDEQRGILSWAPNNLSPLPNESPSEHIRNGLQMLAELEALLLSAGDYTQDRRALMADTKRRLGWALRGLAPHAL